ncbi:hypothetical protein BKA62DRAFT_767271 [Auriculariales sp. MPI-PUGE-AT-0066]|nr:hypothetical protein BKA62DRAFT_767271 [Auriculariales sp. MPI-PUGE-AT-0066]
MTRRVLSTFVVLLPALVTLCAAQSNTTCTGPAARTEWWNSEDTGRNPCQLLESLMQQCDADYQLPVLNIGDHCNSKQSDGTYNILAPCCCSSEAFALQQACWSCQHNGTDIPQKRLTLREYIHCPKNLPNWQDVYQELNLPAWACFGITLDGLWTLSATRGLSMSVEKTMVAMGKGHDDDDDDDDDEADSAKTVTMASIIGSLSGLCLVAVLLATAIVVRRRRQQQRIARDSRSSGDQTMPAWFAKNPEYHSSTSDSHTYVEQTYAESEKAPLAPPPTLGRGRFAASVAPSRTDSWWSSLAREPYVPRARNTLEPHDYANRSVVSMIRSEAASSRESLESERTIESFSNSRRPPTMRSTATHAFSV